MRNGCAGVFTPGELASGRGLAAPAPRGGEASIEPGLVADPSPDPPGSLSPEDLGRIRRGDLAPFGAAFRSLAVGGEPPLPGGRLALLDSASAIDRAGGAWKGGFIRCEARVDPRAWYLESHFRGDEVMPGTLMYDASLQALRLYLMGLGWLPGQGRSFAPARGIPASLRCRGQVTPRTRSVAYDVHVKELRLEPPAPETGAGRRPGRPAKRPPEPVAVADCVMWADGRPIVEVTGMSLALAGGSLDQLASQFRKRRPKGRPPAAAARAPEAGEPGSAADPGPASRPAARQAAAPGPAPRTASRQAAPPGPAARTAAGGPTPRGRHFYPRESVRFLSSGPISGAFGPLFSRFDDGSFFPHLPQAPYDFLDEAEVIRGEPGSVAEGSELVARHELDPARWTFAEAGGPGILPYAALNETALQPCGFLASFMGSFLPFPGPMHFRNLGGEATVLRELTAADSGILETRARLTSHRAVGGMVIQNYAFSTSLRGEPVYEGVTKFGFHSPEDLARQQGVRFRADSPCPPRPPEGAVPESYPRGPAWPQGRWRMLERLLWAAPPGAGRPEAVWGRARVNPGAWFFSAHFPQDPVWPGSLGLEAFFQAAKALAFRRFRPGEDPPAAAAAFSAPVPGRRHGWEYRGQIVPLCRECSLAVQVTSAEDGLGILTFRGVLWADELPIYRVDGFSVRIHGL
ncbi:MAG: hypothetical protein LBG06_10065 [Deltaproteobacteria bacterium]|nr:hypothetical protein [Deltaproteobacteria bacterium]